MNKKVKSGKQVVNDFFAEILNIEGVDKKTVKKLVLLYREGKLTDKNIQNALEELKQAELIQPTKENGKD